jgi:hypothetical protein
MPRTGSSDRPAARAIVTGTVSVACSISLVGGAAITDGAFAVLLCALAAAVPLIWVFVPDLANQPLRAPASRGAAPVQSAAEPRRADGFPRGPRSALATVRLRALQRIGGRARFAWPHRT